MHITITGRLGSGKSTVAGIISKQLGYEIYSTGAVQRSAAEKLGITTLELNQRMMTDPGFDHIIDDTVTKLSLERENIIFDSRMAWHFARNAFRVFISVDTMEAARRVQMADRGEVETYSTVEEAEAALRSRGDLERERFISIYGVDYLDKNNYDLVVDSTHSTPEEVAAKIIDAYKAEVAKNTKKIEVVHTDSAPAAIGPYSQAMAVNGFLYTSGQIPIDPATGSVDAVGITAQTEQVCRNLGAVLEAAGASFDRVFKTTCFLADMADFAAFNEIYAKYFTSKPARSCVAVKTLPKNVLVEIEVIAVL